MFGLEGHKKKKKAQGFVFELEKEFGDPKTYAEIKQRVEKRIQEIKKILRSGEEQDDFEKYGKILHGYTSILKVMSRFKRKR